MTWVNIIAVIISPVIAVLISMYIQDKKEKRMDKMELFKTLLLTKNVNYPLDTQIVKMYNMINIYYYKNTNVRQKWNQIYDLLCEQPLNGRLVEQKKSELLYLICKDLGYKSITHIDFDRIYFPVGISDKEKLDSEISTELLRVLKNSDAIITVKNNTDQIQA